MPTREKGDEGNKPEGSGMGRFSEPEGYVLRGGRAGAERLRLLNRVKWPTTEPLLVEGRFGPRRRAEGLGLNFVSGLGSAQQNPRYALTLGGAGYKFADL